MALLAVAFVVGDLAPLHAQDDWLGKPVQLKVKQKRLDKVLDQIGKQGNILFSYDSRIVPKDRLITLTVTESALREVLALMLGDGYDFREAGNYVIVRKKATARRMTPKYALVNRESVRAGQESDRELFPVKSKAQQTKSAEMSFKKIPVNPRPKKIGIERPDSPELEASKQVMRNIIGDLLREKIVADKDSLHWFGLDDAQFVVNGQAMPDSLHATFKSRYLKPDGIGYYYGPVKVTGKGVFFDKNDLQ